MKKRLFLMITLLSIILVIPFFFLACDYAIEPIIDYPDVFEITSCDPETLFLDCDQMESEYTAEVVLYLLPNGLDPDWGSKMRPITGHINRCEVKFVILGKGYHYTVPLASFNPEIDLKGGVELRYMVQVFDENDLKNFCSQGFIVQGYVLILFYGMTDYVEVPLKGVAAIQVGINPF